MGWNETMNGMLNPIGGVAPHITSGFAAPRTDGTTPHVGVDFNYNNGLGQAGINLTHPPVFSPVTGTVDAIDPKLGFVSIVSDDGLEHQILHLNTIEVDVGDDVDSGDEIGTMGGVGAGNVQHVHYQIIGPN